MPSKTYGVKLDPVFVEHAMKVTGSKTVSDMLRLALDVIVSSGVDGGYEPITASVRSHEERLQALEKKLETIGSHLVGSAR